MGQPITIDGIYGEETAEAVANVQAYFGLPQSEAVGPDTYALFGQVAGAFGGPAFGSRPLGPGTVGGDVTVLQNRLNTYRYARILGHPGDGMFDTATQSATAAFGADGTDTVLKHEDLLVSNINNAANVMGQGTTVERIWPGVHTTFFSASASPIALATSNLGATWIANFGLAADGSQGNLQVITPNGALFSGGVIQSPLFAGPWGQVFNFGPLYGLPTTFFSTNVLTGTVDRISHFVPPDFADTSVIRQIGSDLAHSGTTINNVVGPQGMVWSPINDGLFVADGADNRIAWYPDSSTVSSDRGPGATIYRGEPLHQPAGLALNPQNGNLLAVNQLDNALVEINPVTGCVVARIILDQTPVNPQTGAGSALFGLATTVDAAGDLVVYFVNNNTNTLNRLFRPRRCDRS